MPRHGQTLVSANVYGHLTDTTPSATRKREIDFPDNPNFLINVTDERQAVSLCEGKDEGFPWSPIDVRPGHLSVQYRRSGKREIGYNQLSFTFAGRSRTEYVRDDDLPRVRKEVETFHRFRELCDELVGLSVEASRARTADRIRKEEEDA